MQSPKEDLALKQSSQERDIEKRKRHAEAQKRYREKQKNLKRSEICSKDVAKLRESELKRQKKRRANMTKEEKDFVRTKDRESKAKKKKERKEKERKEIETMEKNKELNPNSLNKMKVRQKKKNIKIQRKIRSGRTEEQKEKRNAER